MFQYTNYGFCLLLLLLVSTRANAQFTESGKIEYERKSNIHLQLDDTKDQDDEQAGDNSWLAMVKQKMPKFMSSFFDLSFTPAATLYKPGREVENPVRMMGETPAKDNIVFTDMSTQRVTASKKVYEQRFLIEDSVRTMSWKIMDEIRIISNFKCRKAVSKYCDSVYVVAFYTDEIPVSGGPEMFAGLPGMILQVAIPRLHTTWTATKIELVAPQAADLKAPDKGKKVSQKDIYTDVLSATKRWGRFAQRSIWWTML